MENVEAKEHVYDVIRTLTTKIVDYIAIPAGGALVVPRKSEKELTERYSRGEKM